MCKDTVTDLKYHLESSLIMNMNPDEVSNYIANCENEYKNTLLTICKSVIEHNANIILLAGPSCSGKTTTSSLIIKQLEKFGKHVKLLSLDDFFREKESAPLNEDGTPDFDRFDHIDKEFLGEVIGDIENKKIVFLPQFDFISGARKEEYIKCDPKDYDIFIFEGLHSLNDEMIALTKDANVYNIYVTVQGSYIADGKSEFSSRDIRFVRRMTRDYFYRGSSPENTFNLWKNVIRREEEFIFPFTKNADCVVSTCFEYELCIMKEQFLSVISHLPRDSKYKETADILKSKFADVIPISKKFLPEDSPIFEFIS